MITEEADEFIRNRLIANGVPAVFMSKAQSLAQDCYLRGLADGSKPKPKPKPKIRPSDRARLPDKKRFDWFKSLLAMRLKTAWDAHELADARGCTRAQASDKIKQLFRMGMIARLELGKYHLTDQGREVLQSEGLL